MKKRPGVMLYFDRLTFLDRLDDAQRGKLFSAIIQYARDGAVPQITDVTLGMAWDILRPVLDLDAERYEAVCAKNRENARKRWSGDAVACDRMPKTNPNTNQTQTEIQTQTHIQNQTQTKIHSHSQKETARNFADSESLMALRDARRREWDAERDRLAAEEAARRKRLNPSCAQ